ncbi:MAG: hypothetical protein M0C28_34480 [Candidatus Moduliflexus flocculans]|nr:hypothetical protein [Candidatus Moduliflexus flocculans]
MRFSLTEKAEVRQVLNSERFADQAPREVYASLIDEGKYLCSWRTMYRILDENQEVQERRNQLRHPQYTYDLYHARPEDCAACPLRARCLKQGRYGIAAGSFHSG